MEKTKINISFFIWLILNFNNIIYSSFKVQPNFYTSSFRKSMINNYYENSFLEKQLFLFF